MQANGIAYVEVVEDSFQGNEIDLPERFHRRASLNDYDSNSFYGGGEHGYTDYPLLE